MVSTDTYEITRTVNAGEAVVFPNTPDLTGRIHTAQINTDRDCQVEIQNSEDAGATWETVGEDYQVDNIRDLRSIFCDGLVRVTVTSNEATASQTVTLTIATTSVSSLWVSPEDVWRTAGITADVLPRGDVSWFINRAIGVIEDMTGRKYEATQVTETYAGDSGNVLMLDHAPIISLDTLTIDGTSVTPDNVDVLKIAGKLLLTSDAEETTFKSESDGSRTTSVTYTHGTESVPENVKRLTECIAALMMLAYQLGTTYDDITNYSVGGLSANLGEPYMNIKAVIERLDKEKIELMRYIKKQPFMA